MKIMLGDAPWSIMSIWLDTQRLCCQRGDITRGWYGVELRWVVRQVVRGSHGRVIYWVRYGHVWLP